MNKNSQSDCWSYRSPIATVFLTDCHNPIQCLINAVNEENNTNLKNKKTNPPPKKPAKLTHIVYIFVNMFVTFDFEVGFFFLKHTSTYKYIMSNFKLKTF